MYTGYQSKNIAYCDSHSKEVFEVIESYQHSWTWFALNTELKKSQTLSIQNIFWRLIF